MTEDTFTSDTSSFTDLALENPTKLASLDILSVNKSHLFNEEQSTTILNSCIEELWLPTKVVGDNNLHRAKRQKVRGDVTAFPFMDIRAVTKLANDEIYDFNLLGIIDQDFPQIFKYAVKDFYEWHIDLNQMAPSRKLTFIINLSNPDTYTGGDLEFLNVDTSDSNINEAGSCIMFPSFMPWRITPVKSGEKHIIVGHVHGALFK